MIKFLSSSPETALAILGGLAGSRAGLPGAALGAFGGYALGRKVRQNADDSNTDLKFRLDKFNTAKQNYRDAKAFKAGKGSRNLPLADTAAEFVKQGGLVKDAQAAYRASKAGGVSTGALPTVGTAEGASAASKAAADAKRLAAEQKRDAAKALADERRYQQDLGRSRDDQLNAQLDLTVNQTDRVNIQQAMLDNELRARLSEIDTDKDLTAEQKSQLSIIEKETGSLRARLLHRQDQEEVAKQDLERVKAANDNQQDLLTAQANLARTAKERGAIERQILDLQFAYLKQEQQTAIDDARRRGDTVAVATGEARLGTLGKLQGYAVAKSTKDNQGPLASYLDSIPKSAAEVNEAIEGIQANGLSSLIDGLSNVEGGFKGLAATVHNVANQIIQSLLKIGLQRGIAALFGNALSAGAGLSGFSSSDFLNSSGGPLSPTFGGGSQGNPTGVLSFSGARAKGGPVTAGKMYMVGEKGPEPFIPNTSGTIIPNGALNGGGVMEVRLRDAMLDARIISGSSRVTQAGIEQNNSQQSKYAGRRLGR